MNPKGDEKKKFTEKHLYDLLAGDIPQHFSKLDKLKILYRPYITPFTELLNLIPLQSSVFEIGFGNGAFLSLISQLKDPRKLGGVEIVKKLVDNARDLISTRVTHKVSFKDHIFLSQYDGINLPDLHAYDVVLLIDVLHHIPKKNVNAFLAHIKTKMRPGSTLILKDIDASKSLLVLFNKLHDLVVSQEIGNEIPMESAKARLTDAGYSVKTYSYKRMLWYPHYTITAKA